MVVNDRGLDNNGKIIAELLEIEEIKPNVLFAGDEIESSPSIIDDARIKILVKMLINVNVRFQLQLQLHKYACEESANGV